jgi:hypothetical protein
MHPPIKNISIMCVHWWISLHIDKVLSLPDLGVRNKYCVWVNMPGIMITLSALLGETCIKTDNDIDPVRKGVNLFIFNIATTHLKAGSWHILPPKHSGHLFLKY